MKSWGSEEGVQIASDAIQVHGGMGFIEETGAADYRDARIMPIYEGTTAIQSNDLVGRKVLRDGGQTASKLLAQMQTQLDELRAQSNPVAQRTVERMERAILAANARPRRLPRTPVRILATRIPCRCPTRSC
ncbi:MAG: acyl-CoA dehydrogenase family protein [Luteolibacter sp.]